MSDTKEQVLAFINKCDELKKCKFIMATTKIKDILKCIVNCPELYNLFEAVTKDFNYPAVRNKCLVTVDNGIFSRSYVVLPQTVGHRLAFIFCLLVEFDKDLLNFNDFLQQFFPEDGSYFASYQAFCNTIIKGLQDSVAQVFKEELSKPTQIRIDDSPAANTAKAGILSAINLAIKEEQNFVAQSNIPQSDKIGGIAILEQLTEAVKAGNEQLIDALLCGYNYFVLYHKAVSEGVETLIREIATFEQML